MLEKYGHGGDLHSAQELYGYEANALLDYSSNMNPLGPPPSFRSIIEQFWQHITQYPDPIQRLLVQELASHHQLNPEQLLVGNGAAELIDLIVRAIKPKHAALIVPSFKEYEEALQKYCQQITYIEAPWQERFQLSEQQIEEVIKSKAPELFFVGYPNNPTGHLIEPTLIEQMLQSGAYVIVDEAFLDFHMDEHRITWINKLEQYSKLFVIRSMTKMYSIPGIRLGYIAGHFEMLQQMKHLQVPWSVNTLAQLIGIQALKEKDFVEETKTWLVNEIKWMTEQLQPLNVQLFPTVTNYILVKLPFASAAKLQQKLGERGILIRDASTFKGLDGRFIRLAIKERSQNIKLISNLRDVLAELEQLGEKSDE